MGILQDVGLEPDKRIDESSRQAVLDAAAALQVRRSGLAARVATRSHPGAKIVALGAQGASEWPRKKAAGWKELLSVRPTATPAQLRVSLPFARQFDGPGQRVVSVFDYHALDLDARLLIANESAGHHLFGVAPVQMKLIDRRLVVLQGPTINRQVSIMAVTSPGCVEAAWRYWEAAVASAIPPEATVSGPPELSPRQRQIIALLDSDLTDDAVASTLGISVRTVRADVAAILRLLGVRTRFAAGMRLRTWTEQPR